MIYKDMLRDIPGSYDDFVNSTAHWMEKDEKIRNAIMVRLENYPDSNEQDIMMVLCDCLGIGEPLELIDDIA